jgi:putrescine transport system permease protein
MSGPGPLDAARQLDSGTPLDAGKMGMLAAPARWLLRLLPRGRSIVTAVPYLWLLAFFVVPFLIVLRISFSTAETAQPPYSVLWSWADEQLHILLNFANFITILGDDLYITAYINSMKIAAIATFFTLLLGYPIAYGIARTPMQYRTSLLMLIVLPFWTSFLIRVYAWMGILSDTGYLNQLLLALGIVDEPITLLYTNFSVYLGIVYSYLPFMILPLYANLEKQDLTLLEAAADLGCPPWKSFLLVTLPLSLSGIIAGCLLVFIPAVGEFVIPELLGGPESQMIGKTLWSEFFDNRDWPLASAVAVAMLVFLVVPIMLFQSVQGRQAERQR